MTNMIITDKLIFLGRKFVLSDEFTGPGNVMAQSPGQNTSLPETLSNGCPTATSAFRKRICASTSIGSRQQRVSNNS